MLLVQRADGLLIMARLFSIPAAFLCSLAARTGRGGRGLPITGDGRIGAARMEPEDEVRVAHSAGPLGRGQNTYGQLKHALEALDRLDFQTRSGLYASLLHECGSRKALGDGKSVHAHIVRSGVKGDVYVNNHLILMYIKCSRMSDARRVFDEMPVRNVVTWNAMIGGYSQHGDVKEVVKLFQHMQQLGTKASKITFINSLNACANCDALEPGKLFHVQIIQDGLESDVFVINALINMYGKCGRIEDARRVFDRMPVRSVVSWTTMIAGYSRHGRSEDAFKLYHQMRQEAFKPNNVTFISILKACGNGESYALGKLIHAHIVGRGVVTDMAVGNALVNMYGACGSIKGARQVFDKMPVWNVISWTTMIGVYSRYGHSQEAFDLFDQMQQQGMVPSKVTFISILNACSGPEVLAMGKWIHAHVVDAGVESDIIVSTALLNMYGKCNSIEDARMIFDRMPERNVISWNAMIAMCSRYIHEEEAFKLFEEMQKEGMKPDKITFISVLNVCNSPEAMGLGKLVHAHIFNRRFESDVAVTSAIINMYGKCGNLSEAAKILDKMPKRDVFSCNVMIAAYCQHGYPEEAVKLFAQMYQAGMRPDKITFINVLDVCASPDALALGKLFHGQIIDAGYDIDVVVGTAIVNMYVKCGVINDACKMFGNLPDRNAISWNVMIAGYSRYGEVEEAFRLFEQMQDEGVMLDKNTFISILNACTSPDVLELGKHAHACIVDKGFESDTVVGTALLNMYGKCGSIKDAQMIFDNMIGRDAVSWNAMVTAYAQHGLAWDALKIFCQMKTAGVKPLEMTFTSVLNACSHSGLVDAGLYFFNSMSQDHGITPTMEHYNCMVDLLGRAGLLAEAEDLINEMPFQPDAVIWMTLLGSCRIHGRIDQGKRAAEHAFFLDPQLASPYVVLANMYAAAGRWDDVADIRKLMESKAVKKQPGCSWIVVNNMVHEFVARDRSHPQTEEIYTELERLNQQMVEVGYMPDTRLVLHEVKEEQKGQILCYHSERLAIVFGLINTPCGTLLHITKNLRVCSDCHTTTKFISMITGREIVVRDANRFHHFKEGICSCGDYW